MIFVKKNIMKSKLLLLLFLPIICFSQTQLGEQITNPDENNIKPSKFGTGIAISADGTIVASGAPGNNEDSFVRVFKYQNNDWQQLGNDIVNEAVLEKVGSSVSLSADGFTIAIGAVDGGDLDEGVVRIYQFIDNNWVKQGDDILGDGTQFYLGYKIVLTPDAKFFAATAYRNNSSNKGTVKVYENIDGTWTQRGVNLEGEANYDAFGYALDLSDDGNVLAIGSKGKDKAQVFKFVNNNWTQIGNDFTNLETTTREGLSVSLNSNGFRLAVGSKTGVSIYENNAGTWNLIGTKIAFGSYSTLNSKGDKIVIGSPYNYTVRNYIFDNNSWTQRGIDVKKWRTSQFGRELAMSSDGETFIASGGGAAVPSIYTFNNALLSTDSILSEKESTIFPNPTISNFRIKLSNNLELQEVILFNTLGKKVLSKKNSYFDISLFPKGIYFVKIITNKGFITKKIIKN